MKFIKSTRLFLLMILCITHLAYAEKKLPHQLDKIVLIGDSITDGYGIITEKAYPALLQKEIKNKFPHVELLISAISGSVTASAHSRLTWLIKKENTLQGVIVVLGGNDLLRGMKPETINRGYQKLLEVASLNKLPVLLALMPIPKNYGVYQKDLEKIYKKLANDKRVTVLHDFLKGVVGVAALNQTDGIHPNELGHELIFKNINLSVMSWIEKHQKVK